MTVGVTLTGLQILQQFDLVDYTNLSDSSDVEGRALIGGNVTGATFLNNLPLGSGGQAAASSSFAALTIYGNLQNHINLDNGGSAYVGGSGASNVGLDAGGSSGGTLVSSVPESLGAIETATNALEAQLAGLATNSTVNASDLNNVNFTGGGGATAVFSVTASALQSWRGLNLTLNGATSVIINVTGGGAINLASGLNLNSGFQTDQHDIIWNFENATSVSVAGWQGAILAVDATVYNSSAINGSVIANAVSSQGEIHQYTYDGAVCFMPGTLVATPSGLAAIETLAIGDWVTTADGGQAPVRWMGRQTVSTVFADPLRVLPIRVRAGALGRNAPVRDLLVSPCHALLVDGLLVQAAALVNGTSIVRETDVPETFTYHHLELEDHALILAEGVAAETFIDNVGRMAFDNWDEHLALAPPRRSAEELPLPRVQSARQLPAATRRRLARLAAARVCGTVALAA